MRLVWMLAFVVAFSAGCHSLPSVMEEASADAKFLFGGKWDQKAEESAR